MQSLWLLFFSQEQHAKQCQPLMTRAGEKVGDTVIGHGKTESSLHPQDTGMQRSTFHHGHMEPPAPSPPRAIASLSVRVLGQSDHQGLLPVVPRTHEKEGAAPSEPGSAHSVLHLSRSAGLPAGGHAKENSDEDDSNDNESEDDEDWGPGSGGEPRDNKAYPQPQKMPLSVPSTFARSKRKLQPPQHIPPPQPQPHHSPMQLRHPTPPPSPPSDLFPLPDTPKQSPPDQGDSEGEGPEARGQRVVPFPPPTIQRQHSNSSSHSSSPEPPLKHRPGPISLLVHKMESERASRAVEASAVDLSGETINPNAEPAGSNKNPQQKTERQSLQESQDIEQERQSKEKYEEQRMIEEQEREKKRLEEEKKRERKRLNEEEKLHQKEQQERKCQGEKKEKEQQDQEGEKVQKFQREETASKEKVVSVSESQESDSSSDSDSKSDSSSCSSQSSSCPSRNKTHPARHLEVSDQTDKT